MKEKGQGTISTESQSAIEIPSVPDQAASTLEGGKGAFNQLKTNYGFRVIPC